VQLAVERDEFLTAMKLMNPDLTSMQTNDLFQRIDQDGNHCISFIEFLAATLDPDDVDANELKQVRVNVELFLHARA
jgi:Ca2+-binding EF-hand superfamily protein